MFRQGNNLHIILTGVSIRRNRTEREDIALKTITICHVIRILTVEMCQCNCILYDLLLYAEIIKNNFILIVTCCYQENHIIEKCLLHA